MSATTHEEDMVAVASMTEADIKDMLAKDPLGVLTALIDHQNLSYTANDAAMTAIRKDIERMTKTMSRLSGSTDNTASSACVAELEDIEAREDALRRHRQKQAALTEHIKRVAGHLLSESDAKVEAVYLEQELSHMRISDSV